MPADPGRRLLAAPSSGGVVLDGSPSLRPVPTQSSRPGFEDWPRGSGSAVSRLRTTVRSRRPRRSVAAAHTRVRIDGGRVRLGDGYLLAPGRGRISRPRGRPGRSSRAPLAGAAWCTVFPRSRGAPAPSSASRRCCSPTSGEPTGSRLSRCPSPAGALPAATRSSRAAAGPVRARGCVGARREPAGARRRGLARSCPTGPSPATTGACSAPDVGPVEVQRVSRAWPRPVAPRSSVGGCWPCTASWVCLSQSAARAPPPAPPRAGRPVRP